MAIASFTRRFLVADDHDMIRTGIMHILKDAYPGCVIDESTDGTDVTERLLHTSYDLIITDIQMGAFQAVALINYLHTQYPAIPVLVYSMVTEILYGPGILRSGASGFVHKGSPVMELKKAIALLLDGKKYFSETLTDLFCNSQDKKHETPFSKLSPREFQVALLLLGGKTVTTISQTLSLKKSTTGTHKINAFRKLQVSNLLELKTLAETYHF